MSKEGERSRSPKSSKTDDSDLETRMLALWTKSIQPLVTEQNDTFCGVVKGMVVGIVSTEIKDLENKMQTGFVEVNTKFGKLENKVDESFSDVKSTLERLEKAIATSSAPPPMPQTGGLLGPGIARSSGQGLAAPSYAGVVGSPAFQQPVENDVTTPAFTRKTNPTKLFSNMHGKEKVSKRNFTKSIVNLALEANLSEADFCVSGNSLDDRFDIQFSGESRIAAVKCLQFYESLQLGRGKWKPQFATNDTGTDIQFYIAPDKNPCQMRKEILCKHLKGILENLAIDKTFFVKKATGSIYADKRVVVSVVITGPESARLDWCHAKRIDLGIDQGAAELSFSSHVVSGGPGS